MRIDERRAEAAPTRFTTAGSFIPPGKYGQWLVELVETFGPQTVAKWNGEIPEDWSFESWMRRAKSHPLEKGA